MTQEEHAGDQGCLKLNIIEYHDCKTLLGPCFVSFSIPFFVPGVVLTVVGSYGNDSSFPTFGAWHIAGIVVLSLATLMLIAGILLKCFYKPVISAEIEKHLTPMSSRITGNKNLGYDNGIYCSNNAKLNNKVSHHDLENSHRIVSTHESKATNNITETTKQFVANGSIDNRDRQEHVLRQQEENRNPTFTIQNDVLGNESKSSVPKTTKISPQSYDNVVARSKPRQKADHLEPSVSNTSSSVTKGQITVTADIVAEAEIVHASGSHDHSGDDGNEQSRFLPERRRKKKKRRKRHSSLSHQSVDETASPTPNSARETIPDLHTRPVVIHDDTEHQHHNLHVHFERESKKGTIGLDNLPKSVPEDEIPRDEYPGHDVNYESVSLDDFHHGETNRRSISPQLAYDNSQQ